MTRMKCQHVFVQESAAEIKCNVLPPYHTIPFLYVHMYHSLNLTAPTLSTKKKVAIMRLMIVVKESTMTCMGWIDDREWIAWNEQRVLIRDYRNWLLWCRWMRICMHRTIWVSVIRVHQGWAGVTGSGERSDGSMNWLRPGEDTSKGLFPEVFIDDGATAEGPKGLTGVLFAENWAPLAVVFWEEGGSIGFDGSANDFSNWSKSSSLRSLSNNLRTWAAPSSNPPAMKRHVCVILTRKNALYAILGTWDIYECICGTRMI